MNCRITAPQQTLLLYFWQRDPNMQFVVSTGDNFYMRGVENDQDDLWETVYTDVSHDQRTQTTDQKYQTTSESRHSTPKCDPKFIRKSVHNKPRQPNTNLCQTRTGCATIDLHSGHVIQKLV